jgi:hypothetical protein
MQIIHTDTDTETGMTTIRAVAALPRTRVEAFRVSFFPCLFFLVLCVTPCYTMFYMCYVILFTCEFDDLPLPKATHPLLLRAGWPDPIRDAHEKYVLHCTRSQHPSMVTVRCTSQGRACGSRREACQRRRSTSPAGSRYATLLCFRTMNSMLACALLTTTHFRQRSDNDAGGAFGPDASQIADPYPHTPYGYATPTREYRHAFGDTIRVG